LRIASNGSQMARPPRLDLAHIAQHIVQRGNDRRPCFFQPVDYECYRRELREITMQLGCKVHAYVLMTNHVHLLISPAERGQIAGVMQSLGRRYVRYINDRYHRTGTLWEGRYKACLVDSEHYLLRCYRYIELNPLRAAMITAPGEYAWSSYRVNALNADDNLIAPHASYLALGTTVEQRCATYRAFVAEAAVASDTDDIRLHIQSQYAFGSQRFRTLVEQQLGRRAGPAKIGRPRKTPDFSRESAL
jgi:putative transposase